MTTHHAKRAVALVVLTTWGCTSLQPVAQPAPYISAKHPETVYLLDNMGRFYTVVKPHLEGDSVVGVSARMDRPVGMPLTSVSRMLAPQPDQARTVLLGATVAAGAAALVYFAIHAGGSGACVIGPGTGPGGGSQPQSSTC